MKIKRTEIGFGFSVRSSKPVRISGVDQGTEAEVCIWIPVIIYDP